jgi:hypothetical protein
VARFDVGAEASPFWGQDVVIGAARFTPPPGAELPREHLAQRHARAMQARLDRGDRLPEDLGHLFVREFLPIAEHEQRPVVLGQAIEGPIENLSSLAREQLALRRSIEVISFRDCRSW